jgi:dUTP pyrophosphatase
LYFYISFFQPILKCKRLFNSAICPTKGSAEAAGYDLFSPHDYVIYPHSGQAIPLHLSFEFPAGCYGRIAPRSSMSLRRNLLVNAGVIDKDYRGNVCVLLFNPTPLSKYIRRGEGIAQLICERIAYAVIEEVGSLAPSSRGSAGFGSSNP